MQKRAKGNLKEMHKRLGLFSRMPRIKAGCGRGWYNCH